jgi:predicted RNase H-like HicB family nuclease
MDIGLDMNEQFEKWWKEDEDAEWSGHKEDLIYSISDGKDIDDLPQSFKELCRLTWQAAWEKAGESHYAQS